MHVNDWDAIDDVRRIVGTAGGSRPARRRRGCHWRPRGVERRYAGRERCCSHSSAISMLGTPRRDRVPASGAAGRARRASRWPEAVGHELREERHRQERTLADVAEDAGVSTQYLSEVERGRKEPSSEILGAVAGALGLRLVDLTSRCGPTTLTSRPQGPLALAAWAQ